jgi:hypothetical protein
MDREVLDSCRAVVDLLASYGPTLFERGANAFARATPADLLAGMAAPRPSPLIVRLHIKLLAARPHRPASHRPASGPAGLAPRCVRPAWRRPPRLPRHPVA